MERTFKAKRFPGCDMCKKVLVDPVTIPCRNTICKSHVNELLERRAKQKSSFICELCEEEHVVPEDGFAINKRIKSELDTDPNPLFIECRKSIEESKETVKKIESIRGDPECYLYEYFNEIKHQVELRRKVLKVEIDKYSDGIVDQIERTKENCKKLSNQCGQLTIEIEKSQAELDGLIERFYTLDTSVEKLLDLKINADGLKNRLDEILVEFKESLVDKKAYFFDAGYGQERQIPKIFGSLNISRNFKKFSAILKPDLINQLNELCTLYLNEWKLIYRASRDGFGARDFHRNCDGIEKTLTVVKTTEGSLFGGFTEQAWDSCNRFRKDPTAFIFSLANSENKPFKVICSDNGENAIICHSSCGPSFGEVLHIVSDSNSKRDSSSCFGYKYRHPDYEPYTERANSILAGSHRFQTFEIEVFTMKFLSTILTPHLTSELNQLCGIYLKDWALIYRASRDGFRSEDFHGYCDGITHTLTVIKATSGNIFGGYTQQAWSSDEGFVNDKKAYVFSLVNKEARPFKAQCSDDGENAIYCGSEQGPSFGGDGCCIRDICIATKSNTYRISSSSFGHTYEHSAYECDTAVARAILAGSEYFQIAEIEVYTRIDKF